jgi:hypothetical protein
MEGIVKIFTFYAALRLLTKTFEYLDHWPQAHPGYIVQEIKRMFTIYSVPRGLGKT